MTTHIDRARVADELQFRRRKPFRERSVDVDRSSGTGDRNRHGDDGAMGRQVLRLYVPLSIEVTVAVIVDGWTVIMISDLCIVWNGMNVEGERLTLQRTQRQGDENGQAASHRPSVFHAFRCVNARERGCPLRTRPRPSGRA